MDLSSAKRPSPFPQTFLCHVAVGLILKGLNTLTVVVFWTINIRVGSFCSIVLAWDQIEGLLYLLHLPFMQLGSFRSRLTHPKLINPQNLHSPPQLPYLSTIGLPIIHVQVLGTFWCSSHSLAPVRIYPSL